MSDGYSAGTSKFNPWARVFPWKVQSKESLSVPSPISIHEDPKKKCFHLFKGRLTSTAAFDVSNSSLVGAGFASYGMGIFTIFRPAPLILNALIIHTKESFEEINNFSYIMVSIIYMWSTIVLFIFFGLGLPLLLSLKIKNRKYLIIHSWGLLLLYLDFWIWLVLTIVVHIKVYRYTYVLTPMFFFIIYMESFFYLVGYYIYSTYFIVAELTVIEKFY